MDVLYLNKEQADKIKGKYGRYSELKPINISEAEYILPMSVLDDPEYYKLLKEFLKCKVSNIEIDETSDDVKMLTVCKYTVKEIKEVDVVRPDLKIK